MTCLYCYDCPPLQDRFVVKTLSTKSADVRKNWYVVDATQKTLGRLATGIAHCLRGKHKPEYSPHVDVGDYVVVINASKVHLSGNKVTDKLYYRHSGYPGGIKKETAGQLLARHPESVLARAVKGMLPRNALGRAVYRNLRIYADADHPHQAQNPTELVL